MPATLQELRSLLTEQGDRLTQLRTAERTDTWERDVRATVAAIQGLDAEYTARQAAEYAPAAGTQSMTGGEFRTAGEQFISNDAFAEWASRGGRGTSPSVDVERRTLMTTGTSSNDGGLMLPKGSPFMSPGGMERRRLFIRDVVASGTTNLSSVPYVREYTPRTTETAASGGIAEGGEKHEIAMLFESADAPVRKVAAWMPVTSEVVADIPTMRSYIDGRLAYMLALAEELQILNGNGSDNLTGILQTSGIQTQSLDTDKITTIATSIGKIEAVYGEPDAVAINPVTYWALVSLRSANRFDGAAFGTAPYGSPADTLWGLPAIRTSSIAANKALVGAFRLGAQIFDRETVSIRVTDSHSDYFIKNKMVVLAEARLALAVHQPEFFCYATLV